jgi:hypothetical protein
MSMSNIKKVCLLVYYTLTFFTIDYMNLLIYCLVRYTSRDFMYTAQKQFPETEFTPVSTHTTREIKVGYNNNIDVKVC